MSKRPLAPDERLALSNLADRYLAFRDALAPNAADVATQFLSDYAFINRNDFSVLASPSKSLASSLEGLTAKIATGRVAKIAALRPDAPAPTNKDGKRGKSDDARTQAAFDAATDARRILADEADALLKLLARLPGEVPQEQPPASLQPTAPAASTPSQTAIPHAAPAPPAATVAKPPAQTQHYKASELGDFHVVGFPGGNHSQEGEAPLLVHFGFHRMVIPLDDFDDNYELMINSAKLHLGLTAPPRDVEIDREVYDENNAKLRIKREWRKLDGKEFNFLVENPEKSRQLEGEFRDIQLCYVADASTVGVRADLTVAAGQIAVWHKGVQIGSGQQNNSMAAKVVSQWAVWAGLGEPPGENPAYHLGSKSIGSGADD